MLKIFRTNGKFITKTHTGLYSHVNQDRVLATSHPLAKNIKLFAIADGMGSLYKSEFASQYVVDNLNKWFLSLNLDEINNTYMLCEILNNIIYNINNWLYKELIGYPECGTTLTCAVVNENDTVIANIGDSRTYAVIKKRLKQITKDDTQLWIEYEKGNIKKNDIRYHIYNNLINKSIGLSLNVEPTLYTIRNDLYSYLLLFSDGVTDCLSDKKIQYIINNTRFKEMADEIINQAVYVDQREKVPNAMWAKKPINGKDNTSVIVYKR